MADTIQWARLTDLLPIISALAWHDLSYMYLERIPEAWVSESERYDGLRLERLDQRTPFNEWERGRLFCQDFELRWEKMDGAFQVVYVGAPPDDLPGFTPTDELDLSHADTRIRSYYLWGRRVSDEQLTAVGASKQPAAEVFIELRIPRHLHYPVSAAAQQVKVQVCEYIDPTSGTTVYYRFQGLEELP